MDYASVDMGLEYEVWKYDEGILPFECSGELLVVAPLATKNLAEFETKPMEVFERNPVEVGSLEKIDSSHLSLWVINRTQEICGDFIGGL